MPMSVECDSRQGSKTRSFALGGAASVGSPRSFDLTPINAPLPGATATGRTDGERRVPRLPLAGCGAAALLALAIGCAPVAPPDRGAPARTPPSTAAPAAPASPPTVAAVLPAADPPAGPLYTCERSGAREPLPLAPTVDQLCRRHPEMNPCQYERDQCRSGGGRVFTARGEEVTLAVEAEYDKRVVRIRLQADGGTKKR
jgi:hypothetical protein